MSTPDVEEQIPVQTPNIGKHRLLRYALLIAAASYVILSSYYISETRSSLASLAVAQRAAIANLRQRQAATEDDLRTSNQALSQQLGITERGVQAAYAGTTAELRQNQRVLERRLQDQQNEEMLVASGASPANVKTISYGKKGPSAASAMSRVGSRTAAATLVDRND